MAEIDVYLENLYEDLQGKISGTGLILQLAKSPDHLPMLIGNGKLEEDSFNGRWRHAARCFVE